MSVLSVTTFQNVKLQLNSSVVGWRLLAFVIDFLLLVIVFFSTSYVLSKIYSRYSNNQFFSFFDDELLTIIATLIWLPIFLYSLYMEFFFNGQTLGKMICGIKVVKMEGYTCGFQEYFIRWAFRLVEIYPFFVLTVIFNYFGIVIGLMLTGIPAFIFVAASKKGQRLGDIIAGTTVIKLKDRVDLSITILTEVQDDYEPMFPQVIKLSDNDMRIIKDTYLQCVKSKDYKILTKLRKKVEDVTQIQSELKDAPFLKTVIKDFNYYTKDL